MGFEVWDWVVLWFRVADTCGYYGFWGIADLRSTVGSAVSAAEVHFRFWDFRLGGVGPMNAQVFDAYAKPMRLTTGDPDFGEDSQDHVGFQCRV